MKSYRNRRTQYTEVPIVKSLTSQNFLSLSKGPKHFTDPLFPPTENSLYSTKSHIKKYQIPEIPSFFLTGREKKFYSQYNLPVKEGRYSWKRLSDLYNISELNVYIENKNLVEDVVIGELGDCYFLSALAILSQNPENIKKLLPINKISSTGTYLLNIYIHGIETSIVIDDYFPIIDVPGYENMLAFANINSSTGSIWPILLEKAWAKCNLSYEDIIIGNSSQAFEFLTPAPIDTFYHNKIDSKRLFKIIRNSLDKNSIVVCDITETGDGNLDLLGKMGLVPNHSYQIIDSKILKHPNENEIKLLKIKNLYGSNKWLGDWSDGSHKWNEEFIKKCGFDKKEKGIFWIAFDDYLRFYTSTHICHLHDEYQYVSNKFIVRNDLVFNIAKIFVEKPTHGYFIVNMKNKRIYRNLKGFENYDNPFCSMFVFRQDSDGFHFYGSDSGNQDRLYVDCDLIEPGSYYIALTFPKQNKDFDMVSGFQSEKFDKLSYRVGIYSGYFSIKIEEANNNERNEIYDFIYNSISQVALKNPIKYKFTNDNEDSSYRVINFDNTRQGYGYIYYCNNSDGYLRERIKINEFLNFNIIPILKRGKYIPLRLEREEEEIEYEDPSMKISIDNLSEDILDSTAEIIDVIKDRPISEKNPAIIQINIAPHSNGILFFQKNNDIANIDMISDVCFDYLPNVYLYEKKFTPKKFRLRYNNKPVDIFECITEHNTGVFFHYKNRTRDYKIKVTARFSKVENLYLQVCSDDLKNNNQLQLRRNIEDQFRDDSNEKIVIINVLPGETGFFGLGASDVFMKFLYEVEFDYHFMLYIDPEKENELKSNNFIDDDFGFGAGPFKDEIKDIKA